MNTIANVPVNAEAEAQSVNKVRELDESQLALVGGGIADPFFG